MDCCKRMFNRIFICFLIFAVFLCFLSHYYSLGATANVVSTIDLENLYTVEHQQAEISFINYLLTLYSNGISRDVVQKFSSQLDAGYGVYFKKTNNDISALIYEVPKQVSYAERSITLFNSGYTTSTNCFKAYIVTYYSFYPDNRSIAYTDVKNFPNENSIEWIPKSLLSYNDDILYNFTQYISHNAPNLTKIYEAIINVNNDLKSKLDGLRVTVDFSDLDINFQQIITTINKTAQETQNKLDDVKKSIDDTNNFLKDTSDDDVDYSLPSSSSFDDSNISAGLDTIFSNVQNMFTRTSETIVIPVPFTKKSIVIPANYIEKQLQKFDKKNIIKTFVQTVYAYIISRYIYKDLQKRMDEIKEGSILRGKTDTNIKADMM